MDENSSLKEIRYYNPGHHDPGDIWATRQDGVFVVVSARPARWHGEDIDVYGHVDTWYTVRDADEAETALWNAAVGAAAARKTLRARIGASSQWKYDREGRRLTNHMERLDSYDDRWAPPAPIALDDEGVAIEERYLAALAALKGHQ